ncbi:hypothetical protein CH63R_14007 [Colletotrichum higginsianum IMI 349063]|uniref:Uncharacterized protein n=1 Tax=Colletotrichum higginsianum (strain IMI 349063) TaxID=759273 RepID=A0A1B7XSN7_COLHI|nr:hypothetical protein CH63R_14007 [Colletotrichum higginsianum IMI 349063]OBR02781.1 hypothetical protein CH63R_14007 [Colletotrichum higginsianum IMI 349063]
MSTLMLTNTNDFIEGTYLNFQRPHAIPPHLNVISRQVGGAYGGWGDGKGTVQTPWRDGLHHSRLVTLGI